MPSPSDNSKPPNSKNPKRLLVEGKDEVYALTALLQKSGLEWTDDRWGSPVFFEDIEGKSNLKRRNSGQVGQDLVELERQRSGATHFGLVIDADTDVQATWESIKNRWQPMFELPPQPVPGGWVGISRSGKARVGVWIMPDNGQTPSSQEHSRMLESFLLGLIPNPQTSLLEHARQSTAIAKEPPFNAPFRSAHWDKAVLSAWCAWQDEPGLLYSFAVREGLFDTQHPLCQQFVAWFRHLFEI